MNKTDYVYNLIDMIEPHCENDDYYKIFLKLERFLKEGKNFKLDINDRDLLQNLITSYSDQKECDTINFFLRHKYYFVDKKGTVYYNEVLFP